MRQPHHATNRSIFDPYRYPPKKVLMNGYHLVDLHFKEADVMSEITDTVDEVIFMIFEAIRYKESAEEDVLELSQTVKDDLLVIGYDEHSPQVASAVMNILTLSAAIMREVSLLGLYDQYGNLPYSFGGRISNNDFLLVIE